MNDDAALHRRAASLEATRIARAMRGEAAARWVAPEPGPRGYPKVLAANKRRIGFVSADFRTHATSMLLVQVLEQLDRSRFEVVLYSHGADDGGELRRRVVAAADAFVECAELAPYEQVARIRDDGIAILIDLSGYTHNTRLGVFALRPAPLQALWLAYPSTTGSDFIDYLLGDPILTPLEHAEDFSEKLAQLPLCYEPTDRERIHPQRPSRAACGLPEDAFVFACFNQSYKITQPVFASWCRILERVPGSVLWLLVPQENIRARLAAQAAAHGIDAGRLLFAPFVGPDEHLARLQCADVFLDTFPYGAHTTCSDALWMGLPVLTRIGRSFSARVAASLLNAAGLPELAVAGAPDYEELAVRLAADREALADIRRHLREHRLELPLFDSARFTRELEALFDRMLDRWTRGLPPAHLPAQR
jgi:predicted O-linked N-acetylglucosamine transferase (SPINDLY family)